MRQLTCVFLGLDKMHVDMSKVIYLVVVVVFFLS